MSNIKTNVMRILDSNNINYNVYSYNVKKGEHIDGIEVANKIGKDVSCVYKTLVAVSNSKTIYVYLIAVNEHLDLKKAARVANEKSIEMINVNDINKFTGYIRGGCSPIGMKKSYKTFINESAKNLDMIVLSAGKIGYQVEICLDDLNSILDFEFSVLTK